LIFLEEDPPHGGLAFGSGRRGDCASLRMTGVVVIGERREVSFGDRTFKRIIQDNFSVLFFTLLAFLVMGYHPGFEDDAVYLTAVKADLNPALFPHDSEFFRLQMQASEFYGAMARFVKI